MVVYPAATPVILEQPVSQRSTPGSSLVLSVGISDRALPTVTYKWFKNGVAIEGQTGNSLYIPSFDPNVHSGSYRARVTNREGTAESNSVNVGPDNVGTYSNWQAGYFTPTQLANPAISGDGADFDKDGIPNLLEYLLGGNPIMPNSDLLPALTTTPVSGGRNLIFSYKRKLAATGVTQVIESRSSLSSIWTPVIQGQNGVTITTSLVDAQTEQVTTTIPMAGGKGFVRLRATR